MSTADSLNTTATLPPVALIAGPTASGKSDCAVLLAQALVARGCKAAVINADSAQVYGDLRILSARPAEAEMGGIEHRLFGTWDGATACSAADWAERAKAEISDIHAQGGVPILAGGTGLYMRTLLNGIAPVPEINPQVRQAVRALPTPDAYAALAREDPERAAALAPADSTRIARALEVIRSTGRGLASWQAETVGGIGNQIALHPLILLPEREMLYARCDLRFARMLEGGAIEEVRTLMDRNLDPALPVMRAIGVREIAGYLRGDCALGEAATQGCQSTRNYAKRQYTWFRNQPPQDWPRIPAIPDNIAKQFEILFHTLPLT